MRWASSRWPIRFLIFGIWTFLGVFFTVHTYLVYYSTLRAEADLPKERPDISWAEALRLNLAEVYIWALFAPLIFRLARRFPFNRRRWKFNLLVHVLACLVVAIAEAAISALASEWLRKDAPKPSVSLAVLQLFFIARFHQNVLSYWIVFGISQAVDYYHRYRERELHASQLQAQLAQAQLQLLKMQLHPHFLFNTLNAISALVHQDVELADRMIARLGELLRATLENANLQEVPLRQELEFIQPYLEIEQARLGPRLRVRFAVDAAAMDSLVPNMILQPLVENAIRHGIAPRAEPGTIEISAQRDNGTLRLTVRDDGPGIRGPRPFESPSGLGLANTRARLRQLYGPDHGLEMANAAQGGFEVLLTIPFRERPSDHAPTATEGFA
ncbi:MAG TPA: histidine kinase [Gemmataceae bacterium]|nr:histidine kinase [Gemmataceae bacterium]